MKKVIQLGLLILMIVLGWILYRQFADPIEFSRLRREREAAVVQNLKDIRTAQRAFKRVNMRYIASFDTLIDFILYDSLTYVRGVGSFDDSAAVAQGLVYREEFKMAVKDTIFSGRGFTDEDIRNLRFIPYSEEVLGSRMEFIMDAGVLETASAVVVQVFEAKAPYKTFLDQNEWEQELINLIDTRKTLNKYPGLKVGSMTEATNDAGNWE